MLRKRELRICYYNPDKRVVDANLAHLESSLSQLGTVDMVVIESLTAPNLHPCDLLIVAASHLPEDDFAAWLQGLAKRIVRQNAIWIPCLVVADIPFTELADKVLPFAVDQNWYFDVLSPDHMSSLPIRVANLLRIHDHLHELDRYAQTLNELAERVERLEAATGGESS